MFMSCKLLIVRNGSSRAVIIWVMRVLLTIHMEDSMCASISANQVAVAAAANNSGGPKVPALFIFGDSTVDTGNNNYLWSIARANFLPFGRDFDTHQATGRFSNGRLSIDYLASFLNLPLPPPYLSRPFDVFIHGVNFASAGSGILNSTGDVFGEHIPMEQQLAYFMHVKAGLVAALGPSIANDLLARSMYYISVGTNDYLKSFLNRASDYYGSIMSTEIDFQNLLVASFSTIIERLYNLGARRIVVASLPPMGCIPSQLEKFGSVNGSPLTALNLIAQNYNQALLLMLLRLQFTLPGSLIVYNNVYDLLTTITSNPAAFDYKSGDRACCGFGIYGGALPCLPELSVCTNASEYVFWDEFHPTSRTYYILARTFWEGGTEYNYPMNVSEMVSQ